MTTTEAFLGTIAPATLITAIAQVGVLIAGIRLARRVNTAVERIEGVTGPVVARLDDTVQTLQTYVQPARQGVALLAGARAAVLAFRRPPFGG